MQIQHIMFGAVILALCITLISPPAQAAGVPTKVMIRAISHDAKVIGTGVGGARITIRDVRTGKVLAQGIQKGGTGNTELIMVQPHKRGETIFDTPDTAGFLATVTLEHPTTVEVTAEGPLEFPQAMQRASKTLLLVPGKDVVGEGVLLEIYGFIVKLLAPASDTHPTAGQELGVRATVHMA